MSETKAPILPVVRLSERDNVAVARANLETGTDIGIGGVAIRESVPSGHKIALSAIPAGEPIVKYGQIIGFAVEPIEPGRHIHVHNVRMDDFDRDYAFGQASQPTAMVADADRATFNGFRRSNGSVGTRNYVGVLTSVNCSATVARHIAKSAETQFAGQFPNVDGVVALTHSTGCGMADTGEGYLNLQRVLWGYARHPNFAGILMVGLGCEVAQIDFLLEAYGIKRGALFQTMNIQETGGTRKTVERGVEKIASMLPIANQAERAPASAEHLTLALQCGGSDAYSGITANPSLGAAADLLVRHGGTAVLAETPEVYGAEHLLTRRATKAVGEKLIERLEWWEDYTARNKGEMNNNPSPGNKAGGLTTILEKSLGAVAKGGTTNLNGVYLYGEPIRESGFVFMDSPGYDPCSITGQVASGSNLICFTTGRGSVFGCKPVPSVKIATNSAMYHRMDDDMDINAGDVIDHGVSIEDMGERIFAKLLEVASGERSKSETHGIGDAEFIPWQIGAVM
ncbi:MAG: altronate dehydratase family protein [Pseudomonadota bacterium]